MWSFIAGVLGGMFIFVVVVIALIVILSQAEHLGNGG